VQEPDPLTTMRHLPLDHVGIAVPSLEIAIPTYELLTGARHTDPVRVDSEGVILTFVGTGIGRVELLQPTSPDSAVARFLERRGPGLHHLAYRVPDIETALSDLTAAGLETVGRAPRIGAHGHRIAFLDPRSTGGVLIELVEEAVPPRHPDAQAG